MPIVAYHGAPQSALPAVLAPVLSSGFRHIGQRCQAEAVATVPRRTGRLASSHQYTVLGGNDGVRLLISAGANTAGGYAPYALAVHQGRGPVDIYPRRAKALRFMSGGHIVFARHVHQPARRANPWLWRSVQRVLAGLTGAGTVLEGTA